MAIKVKWGRIPAESCSCGDAAREHPSYEAWIATDDDYPGFLASTTKSAEDTRDHLAETIAPRETSTNLT